MQIYTWNQISALAGIYGTDSPMESDCKFWQWIGNRKYHIVEQYDDAPEISRLAQRQIEILIIKDTRWKKPITM